MRTLSWVLASAWISLAGFDAHAQKAVPASAISWKKTTVDKIFRSEGVGVADFNGDGKLDIFVGDCWYEAPTWKRHVVRADKEWNPAGYSESFACFPDDFNGDGFPDVIVIPFPGKQCFWYENPGKAGGKWKEHLLTTSACNETPIYVDLFKTNRKLLVMGWNPPGSDTTGEMCYFTPGKDPTQPWTKHSVSGPSTKGKEVPGTRRFSHGLGHGDVNGDGRIDILCTGGWWEQPEKVTDAPWKFHPANLGPACADMYTLDMNGDGKADVLSSSAHAYGFWWYQQKEGKDGPAFTQQDVFLTPATQAGKDVVDLKLGKQETALFEALRKARDEQKKAQFPLSVMLMERARTLADAEATDKDGLIAVQVATSGKKPADVAKEVLQAIKSKNPLSLNPGHAIGLALGKGDRLTVVVGPGEFSLMSETHALIRADINNDGIPDLVTGRRWWAHGGGGDPGAADPAYVYWFEGKKSDKGRLEFVPHEIDDDSGVGTQFVVIDINGDGLLDVVISNKRGVCVIEQLRRATTGAPPGRRE